MPECVIMVGPPGSGKSTLAATYLDHVYINQDVQNKEHLDLFQIALIQGKNVIVDRMGFSKSQRARYLAPAKAAGYTTKIIVLHESYDTCINRMSVRQNHPTIKDILTGRKVLHFFFRSYERPDDSEADLVDRRWPDNLKLNVIYSDLDGTLCDIEHRRHHVRNGKKDWPAFFRGIKDDKINQPVMDTLKLLNTVYPIVYCSGRSESHREETNHWLIENKAPQGPLYMRPNSDSRQDYIVKEILLDFELLTRYKIYFCLDDRDQVVKMLRSRGLTVFQVAEGNF